MESNEICGGCGAEAPATRAIQEDSIVFVPGHHPMVGIGQGASGEMESTPVCAACHQDPGHRTTPLRMHFFPREQRKVALASAKAQVLLEEPTDKQRAAQEKYRQALADGASKEEARAAAAS